MRITQIKRQIEGATSDYDNEEQLQERMARLLGGVALIRAQKALEKLEGANEDAAVAVLLLTAEAMVAESPKDDEHKHGGMPDMDGMGDMGDMGM